MEREWCDNCAAMRGCREGRCVVCQTQVWPPKSTGVSLPKLKNDPPTTKEAERE